ncbi:hypothetical protein BDW74DRAFT_178216 [Aspergillus multicolor]|uniref:uncharacterized protein n=1 Tax=Aspergillus multicolor TaxID=41759 RepID=UPI003CCDC1F1
MASPGRVEDLFALHLTTARLPGLPQFVSPVRCLYVRKLDIKVTLPEYSVAERIEVETDRDRRRNNESFTATVCELFEILHSWPVEPRIELSISAASPSDWTEDAKPDARRRRGMKLPGTDILHWRYMASYLKLLVPPESIPIVSTISSLDVWGTHRNVAPETVSKIISRMANLETLTPYLSDNERKDKVLRDSLRNNFARSLTLWPTSLGHLFLTYTGSAPANADFPPFKRSRPGADALCIALWQLSQQLKSTSLEGFMAGPELFWPQQSDENNTKPPIWPNLTSFHLTYAAATPFGTWLFGRGPRCSEYEFDGDEDRLYMNPPMDEAPQDEFPDDYRAHPLPALE